MFKRTVTQTRISGLTELFSQSIGISEPWYIRSIETKGEEVHIYVDIRDGNLLPCPECREIVGAYEKMRSDIKILFRRNSEHFSLKNDQCYLRRH